MNTLAGVRRRGYTPESIRLFAERIGVSKADSWIDMSVLEDCLRQDLNERAPRRIAVLDPLKVVIDNYPENQRGRMPGAQPPTKTGVGEPVPYPCRKSSISNAATSWKHRPKGISACLPGAEVRLRYAYIVKCADAVKE